MIKRFEAMLAQGQDNALLRFSLGNAYLKQGDTARAVEHLRIALKHDPGYSAAWKALGNALVKDNRSAEAISAYQDGIRTAKNKGDLQAAKEMSVFLKRLQHPK